MRFRGLKLLRFRVLRRRFFAAERGLFMEKGRYSRTDCTALLRKKQEQLYAEGLTRYPQRSDFSVEEAAAIKSFFGPWPRALEAAGLKPVGIRRARKKAERIEKDEFGNVRKKEK